MTTRRIIKIKCLTCKSTDNVHEGFYCDGGSIVEYGIYCNDCGTHLAQYSYGAITDKQDGIKSDIDEEDDD